MQLGRLLEGLYKGELPCDVRQWEIAAIRCDSRKVRPNDLFVAVKGLTYDGVDFVDEAIRQGARVIVSDRENKPSTAVAQVYYAYVDDTKQFLPQLVRRFYGCPSQQVRTIGVTGTNGKTTVTYLIESILKAAGQRCGVIGTVNYRIAGEAYPSSMTTPDLVDNQKFLFDLSQRGIEYSVLEVSSHALTQGRVEGIDFRGAVFTNLTRDHLDYHKTQEEYFAAKARLFTDLAPKAWAVINADDPYGQELIPRIPSQVCTYAMHHEARVMGKELRLTLAGTQFLLVCPQGEISISTHLTGIHNVYNILAAAALCLTEGIALDQIQKGVSDLKGVPGRLEKVDDGQDFTILIDYAHTPDALENVLKTIKHVSPAKIILVFGCGGDRDRTKRPLMGKIAGQWADVVIVTSDNPRSEDPESIIHEILPGFEKKNYIVLVNRKEAIERAVGMAKAGDIVLLAGKGHENYQIFKGEKIDFDEKQIVNNVLKCLR